MPTNQGGVQRVPDGSPILWCCRSGIVALSALISAAGAHASVPDGVTSQKSSEPDRTSRTVSKPSNAAAGSAKSGSHESTVPRVASAADRSRTPTTLKADLPTQPKADAPSPALSAREEEPITRALKIVARCQDKYQTLQDYSCTFYKRERVNGKYTPLYMMQMKARTTPKSIYFKFVDPYRGREAIYVEGRNNGRVLAHDVGFTKFLAGTLELDPKCARAMEDNRHPITEAGIGPLLETVANRWALELSPEESVVVIDPEIMVGSRRCLMIESIHPQKQAEFRFYKVRLFIDSEHNLPIRFEGYDWPGPKGTAEMVEEYSYTDLKLNVGLGEVDFDPSNREYSFGRF